MTCKAWGPVARQMVGCPCWDLAECPTGEPDRFDKTYGDAPINQRAIDEAEYQGGFWRAIWALLVGGKS